MKALLDESASRHKHLCPRQVLGVRIGLAGAEALGFTVPRQDKRLLVVVETDGCFVDGIAVSTGVSVGHRTMRVEDYGKVAATFVDTESEQAWRIAPALDVRSRAASCVPHERRRYFAQLLGYQLLPDRELLVIQPVRLTVPVAELVSRPGVRVNCSKCGEEIINEREIKMGEEAFCVACTGPAYYTAEQEQELETYPATVAALL